VTVDPRPTTFDHTFAGETAFSFFCLTAGIRPPASTYSEGHPVKFEEIFTAPARIVIACFLHPPPADSDMALKGLHSLCRSMPATEMPLLDLLRVPELPAPPQDIMSAAHKVAASSRNRAS
jgi:hypothetical protein